MFRSGHRPSSRLHVDCALSGICSKAMDILIGERSTKRKLEYRYLRTISEVPVPAGADEDLFSGVAEVRPCKFKFLVQLQGFQKKG